MTVMMMSIPNISQHSENIYKPDGLSRATVFLLICQHVTVMTFIEDIIVQ